MADNLKHSIEREGDELVDLHLWRLGPGHLGAIVSVATTTQRDEQYYRARAARFRSLSHLTIEVRRIDPAAEAALFNFGIGSDSEYIVARITSPLALKQPTQPLIPPEVRVGP
jgi:hypothetical protein